MFRRGLSKGIKVRECSCKVQSHSTQNLASPDQTSKSTIQLPRYTMFTMQPLTILLLLATSAYSSSEPWPLHWQQTGADQIPMAEACETSDLTAFDMAKGRQIVSFGTNTVESFETPKIAPLNSSAGEQWEFDGVSEDGMSSFVLGFYRDPNYAILGTGNFRLSIEFAFADRTRFYEVYYPQNSVVETCSLGTRGRWADEKDGYSFSFQVKPDMSEAVVFLNSETIKGTVAIKSASRPLTADGYVWPSDNASTSTVPFYHWSEPIPAGNVDVDVVINGKQISWKGMGGHERFWSAFRYVAHHLYVRL